MRRWVLLLLGVAAAPFVPGAVRFLRHGGPDEIGLLVVDLPLLALVLYKGGDKPMVRDRDVPLETLTADAETFLHRARIDRLRMESAAHDEWPRAAGLPALGIADATVAAQLRVRPAYQLIGAADGTSPFLRPGPER